MNRWFSVSSWSKLLGSRESIWSPFSPHQTPKVQTIKRMSSFTWVTTPEELAGIVESEMGERVSFWSFFVATIILKLTKGELVLLMKAETTLIVKGFSCFEWNPKDKTKERDDWVYQHGLHFNCEVSIRVNLSSAGSRRRCWGLNRPRTTTEQVDVEDSSWFWVIYGWFGGGLGRSTSQIEVHFNQVPLCFGFSLRCGFAWWWSDCIGDFPKEINSHARFGVFGARCPFDWRGCIQVAYDWDFVKRSFSNRFAGISKPRNKQSEVERRKTGYSLM